eukprot:COSAG01_NODE_494_length_16322_cov_35.380879_18_plen_239_part_00
MVRVGAGAEAAAHGGGVRHGAWLQLLPPDRVRGQPLARGDAPSIFRDRNGRCIGESQSKPTHKTTETACAPSPSPWALATPLCMQRCTGSDHASAGTTTAPSHPTNPTNVIMHDKKRSSDCDSPTFRFISASVLNHDGGHQRPHRHYHPNPRAVCGAAAPSLAATSVALAPICPGMAPVMPPSIPASGADDAQISAPAYHPTAAATCVSKRGAAGVSVFYQFETSLKLVWFEPSLKLV